MSVSKHLFHLVKIKSQWQEHATKHANLCLIPGTHMVERENWTPKAILCPPHAWCGNTGTRQVAPKSSSSFSWISNVDWEKWYLKHNWLKTTSTNEVAKTTEGIQKSRPLAVTNQMIASMSMVPICPLPQIKPYCVSFTAFLKGRAFRGPKQSTKSKCVPWNGDTILTFYITRHL